jgi:hypothetical protein
LSSRIAFVGRFILLLHTQLRNAKLILALGTHADTARPLIPNNELLATVEALKVNHVAPAVVIDIRNMKWSDPSPKRQRETVPDWHFGFGSAFPALSIIRQLQPISTFLSVYRLMYGAGACFEAVPCLARC